MFFNFRFLKYQKDIWNGSIEKLKMVLEPHLFLRTVKGVDLRFREIRTITNVNVRCVIAKISQNKLKVFFTRLEE